MSARRLSPIGAADALLQAARVDPTLRGWAQQVYEALTEAEQVKGDAAWMAQLARGSSWPIDMAQRVEDAAGRVIAWADEGDR